VRHELSLQERRLLHQARQNAGKGAQQFDNPEPPTDPLGACREALAVVLHEMRQRRIEKATDAQLIAATRRLILLSRDLEREQEKANRPPWWRRWPGRRKARP